MKLNKSITLIPSPYTDKDDELVVPSPIVLDFLDISYYDNPNSQTITVYIKGIPYPIILLADKEYAEAGDYNKSFLEQKLLEYLGEDIQAKLQSLFPKTLEQNPNGPGSILTRMISTLGIKSSSNCSCRKHALEMNEKGPEWCEQNIDTILGWLKEESLKRGLPFIESVARLMVNAAISKSKKLLNK